LIKKKRIYLKILNRETRLLKSLAAKNTFLENVAQRNLLYFYNLQASVKDGSICK